MKRSTILAALTVLSLTLAACQPAQTGAAGPLKVVAVESFLADMAQNVAGDRVRIDTLIPAGLDPHAFEPAPLDVAKLSEAQVILANGAGFETWLQPTIENAGGKARIVEASAGLKSRTAREGEAAVMTDGELADSICADAGQEQPQLVTAGETAQLPAEAGLFNVQLQRQADGSYGGRLRYQTDEGGDFQMALSGSGQVRVSRAADSSTLAAEKELALTCRDLTHASLIPLEKGGGYVLMLSGFAAGEALVLIGPAGGQHHHDGDPHFWLDPTKAVTYVENIRDGLSQADPAGADAYARNAQAYIAKLQELDGWITQQVSVIPPERRVIVTNHESFGYYADRYGFRIIGTIVPSVSTDATPSAQQLARLVDRIRAADAIAIFLETGANSQLAEQVARETGVKVVTGLFTHSVTGADGAAPTYIDMLREDTRVVVEALR